MAEPQTVFLLWHGDDIDDDTPDPKLLGVYSSESGAIDRLERARGLPGFSDHPDNFLISQMTVDKDEWVDGYMEV
jgi:hypothetical protein